MRVVLIGICFTVDKHTYIIGSHPREIFTPLTDAPRQIIHTSGAGYIALSYAVEYHVFIIRPFWRQEKRSNKHRFVRCLYNGSDIYFYCYSWATKFSIWEKATIYRWFAALCCSRLITFSSSPFSHVFVVVGTLYENKWWSWVTCIFSNVWETARLTLVLCFSLLAVTSTKLTIHLFFFLSLLSTDIYI